MWWPTPESLAEKMRPEWFQRLRNDVRDCAPRNPAAEPTPIQPLQLLPMNCGTCGHWNVFVHDRGECRRYAPSGAVEQPWPVTPSHAWCGDFTELRMVHA